MSKGVSSLVTVVILMGFVVLLSVLLFEFGGEFMKDLIDDSDVGINLACSKLDVEIVSACFNDGIINVTLRNNGGEEVSSSSLVVCKGGDEVYNAPLGPLEDLEGFSQAEVSFKCLDAFEVEFHPYISYEGSFERCENFVSSEVVDC